MPTASRRELPEQRARQAPCTTYVPEKLDGFWRLFTKKEKSSLPLLPANPEKVGCLDDATNVYGSLVEESFKQKKSLIMECIDSSDLGLPNKNIENQAHHYLAIGALWAKHAPLMRLSYYESSHTHILSDKNRVLPRLRSEVIDKSRDMLLERPTDSAFRTRLARLRPFLKLGLECLLFVPIVVERKKDSERLTDCDTKSLRELINTSPNADTIAKIGERFRRSIIEGDVLVWKNIGRDKIRNMNVEEVSRRI
ncbi:uncharacterized protein PpBr36_10338 [Pyricularia pennisetigena]|uniref:uncharacterized protein n=1 Tax=Pyricularia pennisetigena TaxID=1578925 RepID=UPI00115029DE|nr:uncharacterized protein PpBr36_10338 [Pyricularia pennisetigena]TLS21472.1 hypothetical protein PpBr36_10338 [Pyricularia pennisetigena]